jgi:peptidoglycan hydrolase CwlO-like protein
MKKLMVLVFATVLAVSFSLSMSACCSKVNAKNASLQDEVTKLSADALKSKEQINRLSNDNNALHAQIGNLNIQIKNLQDENNSQKAQIEASKKPGKKAPAPKVKK